MRSFLLVISLFVFASQTFAQNRYRSRTSGSWGTASTWQVEALPVGSLNWSTAVVSPNFSNASTITVRAGHTVTVSSNLSIDETILSSGAELIINDGVSLTLNNGTGADLSNNSGSVIRLLGESFMTGSGSLVLAGDVHVYSTNASGAVVTGGVQGNVRIAGITYKNTGTIFYSGSQKQFMGNGQVATLNATINNAAGVEINNTSATSLTLNNLTVSNGEFLCANDDLIVNGTVLVSGGTLSLTATTTARVHTINNLNYQSGAVNISNVGATATLNTKFNGLVNLQAGDVTVSSGSSIIYLNLYGDVSGSGYFSTSGSNNYVRFYGSGNFTKGFPLAVNSTVRSLTLDRVGLNVSIPYAFSLSALTLQNGSIVLAANLTINSTLNLASGTSLDFSNYTLQILNSYNATLSGGQLISNAASTFVVTNFGTVGSLNFPPGNVLGTFTINRSATISTTNTLTIANALTLSKGTFSNLAGLAFNSGAILTRNSAASFTGTAPTGGPYHLNYSGTSLTTGPESLGTITNLTSSLSGTLTLSNVLNIQGSLSINSGTFTSGVNAISAASLTNSGTFNAPSSTLTLSGNLTSTGTFNLGTADLILTGSSNQDISTSNVNQFNDITLTKTAGTVSMNSSQNLRGVLTISNGATLDADGASNSSVFTLLSVGDSPGSDASIAALGVGASVVGDVSIQRYWSAADDTYRYISSPVSDATIAQIQSSGIPVTGPFTGSSFGQPECTGCTNDYTNLGWYQETARYAPYYAIGSGYKIAPAQNNDNTEVLVAGRGYELYMWNGQAANTWTSRGTINQGAIPFNVTRTFHNKVNEDGWNLIGNPYPSSIIWEDNVDLPGAWTSSNIDPIIWVWDVLSQAWKFYDAQNNVGDLSNGVIAAGQAFWVVSKSGTPSLTVHEAAKTNSSGQYYRKRGQSTPYLQVSVQKGNVKSSAFLVKGNDWSELPKFSQGREAVSLAFVNEEGADLARMNTSDRTLYPLTLVSQVTGEFTLSFDTENSEEFSDYQLIDKYLDKSMPLTSYSFTITTEAETFLNRFYVTKNSTFGEESGEDVTVSVYPNPAQDNVYVESSKKINSLAVLNSTGQVLVSSDLSAFNKTSEKLTLTGIQPGMYFIKVVKSDGSMYLQKIFKQ